MSGICGWVGPSAAQPSADSIIRSMSEPLSRFDSTPVSLLSGASHRIAVAATQGRCAVARSHGISATLWGRPEFTDPTLAAIARSHGAAAALIEAYRASGAGCCAKVGGPFAFAVIEDVGDALLAVDRMGIHNLVFTQAGADMIFGSTAASLHRHPECRREIDWQAIYHFVHFHMVPGPATTYQGERRLLPGQYLSLRSGSLKLDHYWRVRFLEHEQASFEQLREEFLDTLSGSVRAMSHGVRAGSFLSGGTDSSTISGLLGKVSGAPAETFSIGFAQEGYDEMGYARIAARHFATSHHEYYVTPADIVDAVPRLAAIYDQPFGNSSAVPTYCCARFAAQSGIALLLGGDGGDELFGGNERYATQYLYSLYHSIPAGIRSSMIEPLARHLPGAGIVPPIRWYRRLVEIASTPLPERMEIHNLLTRFGPECVFTTDMLARVELAGPVRLMRKTYGDAGDVSLINRMLAYDFRFTLADSDLPKVMKSCELAGMPVDFPMLDDRLVEFSARLSPRLKLKGTKLRYFFKEALRGFLPDEIIAKTKHGFGLPFGPWMQQHPPLAELVMSSLGSLRKRGIVRDDFIDRLMQIHFARHPGYYGTMAWVLMMLEQWFQHHYDTAA
jgi:asparagine synthase (glutamine-hydrolysing)